MAQPETLALSAPYVDLHAERTIHPTGNERRLLHTNPQRKQGMFNAGPCLRCGLVWDHE